MKAESRNCGKTFCVLPWIHRFTNIGGEIQVCCSSEEYDNNIRDDAGNKMLADTATDDKAIMNSLYMSRLRLQMLNGDWPSICNRCKVTEETGGISRRQSENSAYVAETPQLIETTQSDGTIPADIMSIDFRLGNLCNLACRMCNPRASSRWIGDWNKIEQSYFVMTPEREARFSNYDWYQSEKLLDQFKKKTASLRHLHFAGGEPLIVPEMLSFLKACVENGDAEHIELTYNTNITKLPAALKELWPRFKGVRLLCSVDGFGAVNDFIRYGSHWKTIDRNLKLLDEQHEAYGVTQVQIMCTAQAYNIFGLGDLYDYLAENFKFVIRIPQLIDLYYPQYYSSQILPTELKARAVVALGSVLQRSEQRLADGRIPSEQAYVLESLRSTLNFISAKDMSGRIPDFLRAANSNDGLRKQSFDEVIPELKALRNHE